MKLTEVIDLIHAGYTKDEISALLAAEQEAGTPDKKEKEKEPKTEPEQKQKEPEKTQPEPKTEPKTEPKAEPVPEYVKQLSESIDQLKKAVELQNLTAGRQPEKKRSVEDILRDAMKEE